MQIVERQVGDVVILDLVGKILIGEGDDTLRETVQKLIDEGKIKVVLNMVEVPYVDSAGMGEIVRCFTTIRKQAEKLEQGGRLKLLSLTKKIQDLLAITKLLTMFEVFDNEAEAIASFN